MQCRFCMEIVNCATEIVNCATEIVNCAIAMESSPKSTLFFSL